MRRIAIALCTGMAVFFTLAAVTSGVATRPVVMTAHDLRRGRTITARDLVIREMPVYMGQGSTFGAITPVVGRVAQIDIGAGTPLFHGMVGSVPEVPQHFTVLDIPISGSVADLRPGDEVALTDPKACVREGCADERHMLAGRAVVMGPSRINAGDGMTSMPFAVDQESAGRVLTARESATVIVVTRLRADAGNG